MVYPRNYILETVTGWPKLAVLASIEKQGPEHNASRTQIERLRKNASKKWLSQSRWPHHAENRNSKSLRKRRNDNRKAEGNFRSLRTFRKPKSMQWNCHRRKELSTGSTQFHCKHIASSSLNPSSATVLLTNTVRNRKTVLCRVYAVNWKFTFECRFLCQRRICTHAG